MHETSILELWSEANTSNSGTADSTSLVRGSPWTPSCILSELGDSPETIRQNFSSLTLEQVYGAIAFYLAHEEEIDSNIREGEEAIQISVPALSESRPGLYARLERSCQRGVSLLATAIHNAPATVDVLPTVKTIGT